MSLIAGLDYSTRAIDCVLISEDTGQAHAWHRWTLPDRGDAFDRTRWVRDTMPTRGWWRDMGVTACGIEDPRGQSAGVIYRVQGAILACLPEWLLVHPLIPSEWRALVGLAGNASKDAVKEHAQQLGAWTGYGAPASYDPYDAYCIALATRRLLARQDAA